MASAELVEVIQRYKCDPESVYNTWFVGSEKRMKAFGAIRRGVRDVVESIKSGTFGRDFKGSPLEVVLAAITEQKQVFEGAAHPFFWKPKLRIPDIYEDDANKQKFGAFLAACLAASREDQVLAEISRLAAAKIKGLGPAVANIIYFLHPVIVPPFNTAIVKGFNALFSGNKKLGSWESYLEMRETIMRTNAEVRDLLSKDLAAFAGLLFEIGTGCLLVSGNADAVSAEERAKAEQVARSRHADILAEEKEESEHTHIQYLLIKIGRALKYDVCVARNDRHCSFEGHTFAMLTLPDLPSMDLPPSVRETVSLIDVIWLNPGTGEIVSAFEVEKSTSIYSGILRLEDLARSVPGGTCSLYLVAPDRREKEVMAQFARPAFRADLADVPLAFISFHDLCTECDALCKYGEDRSVLRKVARHSQLGAALTKSNGSG